MATNRTHLSNVINQFSVKNYNLFVNEYRVKESKRMIRQNASQLSYQYIAEAVGFGSVRSFERNFKNIEGICAGEFIKAEKISNYRENA